MAEQPQPGSAESMRVLIGDLYEEACRKIRTELPLTGLSQARCMKIVFELADQISRALESHEARPAFRSRDLKIDWRSHQVWVRGSLVLLTPTEFRMLQCLVENKGWVASLEKLLRFAWGIHYERDRTYVKVYIRYLRQKIERDSNNPMMILTVRGIGYKLVVEPEHQEGEE